MSPFSIFEERVHTSVINGHQDPQKKIGSKSAKNAVIYRGLAPPRTKNCVNASVAVSKSGQNTAIYGVSCLPRFLHIACFAISDKTDSTTTNKQDPQDTPADRRTMHHYISYVILFFLFCHDLVFFAQMHLFL